MDLRETAGRIRSIKIQGAENIAIAAARALGSFASKLSTKNKAAAIQQLRAAVALLESTRPTEPCMRNALRFIVSGLEKKKTAEEIKKEAKRKSLIVLGHFRKSEKKVAELGAKLVKNKYVVFTHCRSSTVIGILLAAKKKGRKFSVYNTETRPTFEGRKAAEQLSRAGIKVETFVDAAAQLAIKDSDIVLFGADAITAKGEAINKIGSGMFAEIAEDYKIPLYVCADSWKFDPETRRRKEIIEHRKRAEVWNAPKKISVDTTRFEMIPPKQIKAIVSELGVLTPLRFAWAFRLTP